VDLAGYRRVFRDIVEGRTDVLINDDKYYIKHLSALDQVDIDDVKDQYYQNALKRGIPKKQEVLDKLKEEGDWTDAEENEIKRQEAFIEQLQKNKTQLVLKTQIDQQNKTIQETRTKINKLQEKKKSLLGVNAEDYSDKRANDYYIIKSFYSDKDLKKRVFEDESDFNELYADEVSIFVSAYNKTFLAFEELKIQEMILQDFYYIYFPFSDDTVGFFGSPVVKLTYNQLKLIVYTKIFKNIFENNQHIPEKIKKDPQALLDYGSISDDAKSKMQEKLGEDKDGSTLFNATEEDFEWAGLEKPSEKAGISLQKAAEKKGGSLSMEDLMELSGIPKK
tara:strand:+ start:1657 stop:2661 length:1005 start_codon:yes stop_codon:yes gene_type:complete